MTNLTRWSYICILLIAQLTAYRSFPQPAMPAMDIPVKNTFVHFDLRDCRAGRGSMRRWTYPVQDVTALSARIAVAAPSGVDLLSSSVFGFTMRREPHVPMGLVPSSRNLHQFVVERVLPGSAMESWNRLQLEDESPERFVGPGDRVLSVNGVVDPVGMVIEFYSELLLEVIVLRQYYPPAGA